jgi:hypothetical protein
MPETLSGVAAAVDSRSDAQRAPSACPRFSVPFRERAQSWRASIAVDNRFPCSLDEDGSLKNRRLRTEKKIQSGKRLRGVYLQVRGEVAERLKAAVC